MKRDIIAGRDDGFRLRVRPGCGIVVAVFHANLSEQMRVSSSVVALMLPSLIAAVTNASYGAVPFTSFLHAFQVDRSTAARLELVAPGTRGPLRLARLTAHNDNNAVEPVAQDEAPAARIDPGDRTAPALERLGTLSSSRYPLRSHRTLSHRSFRGPPVFS